MIRDKVARSFPRLRIILAHLGQPWIEELLRRETDPRMAAAPGFVGRTLLRSLDAKDELLLRSTGRRVSTPSPTGAVRCTTTCAARRWRCSRSHFGPGTTNCSAATAERPRATRGWQGDAQGGSRSRVDEGGVNQRLAGEPRWPAAVARADSARAVAVS